MVSPSKTLSPATGGALFALLATVVWSFNFIAGRGLAEAAPPFTLAFFRWSIALCAVFPFALPELRTHWRHYVCHWKFYCIISLIGIAFFNTSIYIAAHYVPALNLSLVASTSPLFTLVLARLWFGEPLSGTRLAGIIIVLCGVLLLLSRGDINLLLSLSFQPGDILVLCGAASFAVYTLLLRKKPEGGGQAAYFAVTFGLGLLMLLPFFVAETLFGASPAHFSTGLVGGLLYMGIGASLLSFWAWSKAVAAIGPSRASIIYYTLPLFCGIEAVFFLGESITWVHYASGALILPGLLLATRQRMPENSGNKPSSATGVHNE